MIKWSLVIIILLPSTIQVQIIADIYNKHNNNNTRSADLGSQAGSPSCFRASYIVLQWLQTYCRQTKIVNHKRISSVTISLYTTNWHTDISDSFSVFDSTLFLMNYSNCLS